MASQQNDGNGVALPDQRPAAAALQALPEGMAVFSREGHYLLVNAEALALLGFDADQGLLGKRYLDLFPDAEEQPFHRAFSAVATNGGQERLSFFWSPDNRWYDLLVYRAAADLVGVVWRDVTALKAVEIERDRLLSESRLLADSIPAMVWTANGNGVVEYVNEPFLAFTGLSLGDFKAGRWIETVHADDVQRIVDAWAEAVRLGEPYEHQVRQRHIEGRDYRWLLVRAVPFKDASGRIVRWFATCTDIEDEKQRSTAIDRAMKAERVARENAESALRFGETVIGVLGHDLRNPLSAIATGAQMIMRDGTGTRHGRTAERISSAAFRMSRMIDQLLDFTRIRVGGGLSLRPTEADIHEIGRRIAGETELAHPGHEITVRASGDGRGTWDVDRIGQALSNLMVNAVIHGGGDTTLVIDGSAADVVIVKVSNQGTIPPELLPVLFEPFRGSRPGGLGLGLFIAHQIIVSHRGVITVSSDERTTLEMTLPRASLPASVSLAVGVPTLTSDADTAR